MVGLGEWYEGIGLERNGELIVAALYTLMTKRDIVMNVAALPGKAWATTEFLEAAFRYPFVQLGLRRITAFVPASNDKALKLNRHLGFRDEGLLRESAEDGDMIVLGLLREESRYGQEVTTSTRAA